MSIWGLHKFQQDSYCKLSIGQLDVWAKKDADEIKIASDRRAFEDLSGEVKSQIQWIEPKEAPKENELSWSRWVVGKRADSITILPAMPDRSVVVRPEQPLKILPGQKALFYVRTSIFVQIAAVSSTNSSILCKIPTVEMSNIWYGDPTAGELCYSMRSTARRTCSNISAVIYRVVCPVAIMNKSKTPMNIERFCIFSNHLNIYEGVSHLCTNKTLIDFYGETDDAVVVYTSKPADIEPDAKLISPARIPLRKTLLRRGLGSFKMFG